MASSIDVVISSLERSSCRILVPPETLRTIGISKSGGTDVRRAPRVSISESAC